MTCVGENDGQMLGSGFIDSTPVNNINLGVMQETNLTGGVYAHDSDGYRAVAVDAPI